jgi:hypothetical protein
MDELQKVRGSMIDVLPLLFGDGWVKAETAIRHGNVVHMAYIHPSVQRPYFYTATMQSDEGTVLVGQRPVHVDYIPVYFGVLAEFDNAIWVAERCNPVDEPLFSGSSKILTLSRVYFIEGGGLIKIGVSECPDERLRELQRMSPVPLRMIKTIPGGHTVEKMLHKRFAAIRDHDEWFLDTRELRQFITEQRS